LTRFIDDDEREALDRAQAQLDRDNAEHTRLRFVSRALIFMAIAILALTAAAVAGWYHGGRP
jgi:hypothetical protein